MPSTKINVNINYVYGPVAPNTPDIIENFKRQTPILTEVFQSCHVSEPFAKGRKGCSSKPFQVSLQLKLGTQTPCYPVYIEGGAPDFKFNGDKKDYHMKLVRTVAKRHFYVLNGDLDISAEAFDYIRRIPPNEWIPLAKRLSAASSCTEEELEVVTKGDWNNRFFTANPEWPVSVLKTYFEKRLSRYQVAKLHLFSCVQNDKSLEVHQLISSHNGSLNPTAKKYLSRVFKEIIDEKNKRPTTSQIDELFNKIMTIAPEDTQFFVTYRKVETPLFRYYDIEQASSICQITVPPQFQTSILKAIFGDNIMKPRPVLGYSLMVDFADPNFRDVMIPTPSLTSVPTIIHGSKTKNPISFYSHDGSHLVVESSFLLRDEFIELAAQMEAAGLPKATNEVLDRSLFTYMSAMQKGRNIDPKDIKIVEELFRTLLVHLKAQLKGTKELVSERNNSFSIIAQFVKERWPEISPAISVNILAKKLLSLSEL